MELERGWVGGVAEPLVPVVFKVHESSGVEDHGYLIVDVKVHLEGFKGHGGFGLGRCDLQPSAAPLNLTAARRCRLRRGHDNIEIIYTCTIL